MPFATPLPKTPVKTPPTPSRSIMTSVEIKQIHGKLRCLDKLLTRKSPSGEICNVIHSVKKVYNEVLQHGKKPYDKDIRVDIKKRLKKVKSLENLIIRNIIQEKPYDVLVTEALNLFHPSP